jgi:tight adherence protein C
VSWLRDTLGLSVGAKQIARFEQAGVMKSADRDLFVVSRILAPLLAIVVGSFIPWNRPLFMMSLPGFAYIAPEFVLTRMIKRRRERIRLGVPDAVDLLVICVDAGLGLDQAMLRVAQELGKRHPDLQQEFLRINREQRAGKQRLDAWQSMAERSQLVEVDGFVNMLQQTDRFGTPIARALAEYSDLIRQKRRQRAEELAAKTTVKIIFPLVLCIFPSLFIVLLGPPGIKVSNGLGF